MHLVFSVLLSEIQACRQHHVWEPHHCWPLPGLLEEDRQSEDGLLVWKVHWAQRHPAGHQSWGGCHLWASTGETFCFSFSGQFDGLYFPLCCIFNVQYFNVVLHQWVYLLKVTCLNLVVPVPFRMPLRTAWNWWMIPKLQLWMKSQPNWASARLACVWFLSVWHRASL